MRLIDAKQIRYFWYVDTDGKTHEGVTLHSMIDAVPTVDAVEVVRCKDCKHWRKQEYNGVAVNFGYCQKCCMECPRDHYCSYAVRKDGADNER